MGPGARCLLCSSQPCSIELLGVLCENHLLVCMLILQIVLATLCLLVCLKIKVEADRSHHSSQSSCLFLCSFTSFSYPSNLKLQRIHWDLLFPFIAGSWQTSLAWQYVSLVVEKRCSLSFGFFCFLFLILLLATCSSFWMNSLIWSFLGYCSVLCLLFYSSRNFFEFPFQAPL